MSEIPAKAWPIVRGSSLLSDKDRRELWEVTPESDSFSDTLSVDDGQADEWTDASDQAEYMPFRGDSEEIIDVVGNDTDSEEVCDHIYHCCGCD
jgi:hypothetical protein